VRGRERSNLQKKKQENNKARLQASRKREREREYTNTAKFSLESVVGNFWAVAESCGPRMMPGQRC